MTNDIALLESVRDALRADTRIGVDERPIALTLSNGDVVMEGEVDDVNAKRRALRMAAEVIEGRFIIDRLHVRPAVPMEDGEIRDLLRDALIAEPALSQCRVREWVKGDLQPVRDPPDAIGTLDIRVEDGVVTLDGDVIGLGQKRLAGALAWWVPGSGDVINGLGVTPPETDSDFEIVDAAWSWKRSRLSMPTSCGSGPETLLSSSTGSFRPRPSATWPSTMRGTFLASRT
jgi:osmotically-inducible protein OsmY